MAEEAGKRLALVIDDEEGVRLLLRRMLESLGFSVVEATDGNGWKSAVGDAVPSVAIVDLFMPGKDGLDTIVDLKARWPSLPLIAVSGSVPVASKFALVVAAQLGADRTLMKPFELADVSTLLGELGFPPK